MRETERERKRKDESERYACVCVCERERERNDREVETALNDGQHRVYRNVASELNSGGLAGCQDFLTNREKKKRKKKKNYKSGREQIRNNEEARHYLS